MFVISRYCASDISPTRLHKQDGVICLLSSVSMFEMSTTSSELKADMELSGTSSQSELGQEKVQPTTEESGMKSGSYRKGSDGEGTDGSDRDDLLEKDVSRED